MSDMQIKENNYTFIDSQNLNLAVGTIEKTPRQDGT